MADREFRIFFEYVAEGVNSQKELGMGDLQEAMTQDREIRQLAEIIRDATPEPEPLLYSSS